MRQKLRRLSARNQNSTDDKICLGNQSAEDLVIGHEGKTVSRHDIIQIGQPVETSVEDVHLSPQTCSHLRGIHTDNPATNNHNSCRFDTFDTTKQFPHAAAWNLEIFCPLLS